MTDELAPGGQLPDPRAAVIPTRPSSGAPITSAWGGDVHDRTYTPAGARASGPSTAIAAGGRCTLDTLQTGSAATLVGSGLVVGAGMGGLYLFSGVFLVNALAAGSNARMTLRRGGAVFAGIGWNAIAPSGVTTRSVFSAVWTVNDGEEYSIYAEDAMTVAVSSFTMIRIGNAFG